MPRLHEEHGDTRMGCAQGKYGPISIESVLLVPASPIEACRISHKRAALSRHNVTVPFFCSHAPSRRCIRSDLSGDDLIRTALVLTERHRSSWVSQVALTLIRVNDLWSCFTFV